MISHRSVCILLPCLLTTCWQRPLIADPLTQRQAVEVAHRFCERVGAPVTGRAVLAGPAIPGIGMALYWAPCWRVTFPGQATLQICVVTGVVQDYNNDALYTTLQRVPAATDISAQQAINIASAALRATRQREALSLPSAEIDSGGGNDAASGSTWFVGWERMWQSVPYLEGGVGVSVLAATGQITGLTLTMPSPPLTASMAVNVTAAQAASAGERQLVAKGYGDMVMDTVEMRVVQTGVDPAPQTGPLTPSTARVAWVVSAYGPGHNVSMYVDAASEEIIGGEDGFLSSTPPAGGVASEIVAALGRAREIVISGRGARLEWVELAKWGAGSEGFGMVTSASTIGVLPNPGLAPYKIALGSGMNLYYFPEQNLLGAPGCWMKASPQLAGLVKNLPVPASPAPVKKP